MTTQAERVQLIKSVWGDHKVLWDAQRHDMVRLEALYASRYWATTDFDPSQITVEISEGYAFVEGYVSPLFPKAPAVSVESDPLNASGDADVVKTCVDRWLYDTGSQIEMCIRQALIYPMSFMKMAPTDSDNPLDTAALRAVPPWEVILDTGAGCWGDQRFVGHTYYMPIVAAKKRFGDLKFKATEREDFIGNGKGIKAKINAWRNSSEATAMPDSHLYIEVVEFYDMVDEKLCFWSPNYGNGQRLLPIKDCDSAVADIPLDTHDGKPLPPIIPLYFVRSVSKPLQGISSLDRIADQIKEKNIIRSFWANAVRRDTRQFLYKEGKFTDDQLASVTAGIDGAMIGVDEETLDGLIKEVETTPISTDFDRYLIQVDQDLAKGSVLAPFTRGEGTKGATATEVRALYAYSSSEIGRLSRERDKAIGMLSEIYTRYLNLVLSDDAEGGLGVPAVVNGKVVSLKADQFEGKFKFQPLDMASTPIAQEMRQNQFVSLIPVVQGLGISNDQIREQLIELFSDVLPSDWAQPSEEKSKVAEAVKEVGMQDAGGVEVQAGEEPPVARDGLPEVPTLAEL